jgi:hypothetical protein
MSSLRTSCRSGLLFALVITTTMAVVPDEQRAGLVITGVI